jgi:hypothetical protein
MVDDRKSNLNKSNLKIYKTKKYLNISYKYDLHSNSFIFCFYVDWACLTFWKIPPSVNFQANYHQYFIFKTQCVLNIIVEYNNDSKSGLGN